MFLIRMIDQEKGGYIADQECLVRKDLKLRVKSQLLPVADTRCQAFKIQKVWTLVDLPSGKMAIGTKWVYRNKKDEREIVVRNKARLVAQGYKQEKGIDYDDVFAPVARIEAIRLFLAFTSFMNFPVYQMDVKSAFLYALMTYDVYNVCQPPGFVDLEFLEKVYKVEKALYGLHQAPRAWYETLSTYLLDNGFHRGQIDKTLFIKRLKGDILLVQVYVDDIIFGSTKKSLCDEFEQIMHNRFQMSSMGELTFFLGLQVKQKEDGIFISQDKYVGEILKKFGFSSIRTASTPMETNKALTKDEDGEDVDVHLYRSMIGSLMYLTSSRPDIMFSVCACSRFQVQPKVSHLNAVKRIFRYLKGQPKLGLWYPKDSPLILEAFSDSDYAGASLDRKSTTGGCQFLGSRLISWQCKKQTVTKIHVDNKSVICVVKNPVYHSKTKHIEIQHHFIRDSYEKRLIEMVKIHTDYNVADLLTKAFDVTRYALTANPTIYASLIEQFWQTTTVETVNNREQQLFVTVDGQTIAITEASVRRHLQLADADGISSFPNTKIFEQLTLMGYVSNDDKLTFQKGVHIPLFDSMLVHDQSGQGEGPSSPGGTQQTPTIIETSPQLQHISNTYRKTRTRTRRMGIRILQSDVPTSVVDEVIIKEMHDGLVRATTTASSLEAEQGSGNIAKTQTMATSSRPRSPRTSSEGGLGCHFTMGDIPVQARPERVSNLPNEPPLREDKVTSLEDELASTKAIYNKALITLTKRGRMIDEIDKDENVKLVKSRELGKSHDTAEHRMESEHDDDDRTFAETLLNIKRSAAKVEAQWIADEERKPQEAKQTDERENVINWNDPDVLRYHAVQNRPFSKAEVRKNMCTYLKNQGGYKISHFKGMSYEDIRPIFERVWDQNQAFVPKDFEIEKEVMKRPGFDHQQERSKKTRGSRKKALARKRAGEKESKKGAKRQKTEYEKEKEEL
ncbi:putative ribonuclease H-like domain-containing protein [Tanacetum coccineum]